MDRLPKRRRQDASTTCLMYGMIGFIFLILSFLWSTFFYAGIGLDILALVYAVIAFRKRTHRGKAVAGLALSLVSLAIVVLMFLLAGWLYSTSSA